MKLQKSTKLFLFKKLQNYKINKDGNESVVTILHYSARFMKTSLSSLVIISQKEFMKLNAKIVIVFLNMKVKGQFDNI